MKTVFALTSWGNAGVEWVKECINLHPGIHAWSCMNFAPHSRIQRELTAVEYLDCIARLGWNDYQSCGDVHGVGPDHFPAVRVAFGEEFRGSHLIAHPVPRLAGSLAFSKVVGRDWRHRDFLKNWGMERDHPIARNALSILGEEGDHVPAHYMMNVNSILLVRDTGDPLFKLEELMTSDEAWAGMIDHLSRGQIGDYAKRWRAKKGVYLGVAHEPFMQPPEAVWRNFPTYVREVFAAMLSEESRHAFEDLGYDLSYVTRG
jgi:hypothetical protein